MLSFLGLGGGNNPDYKQACAAQITSDSDLYKVMFSKGPTCGYKCDHEPLKRLVSW